MSGFAFFRIHSIALLFLLAAHGCGRHSGGSDASGPLSEGDPSYDSALVERLGADEYGMRNYVVGFLVRGPNADLDPETVNELQRAHLDNIQRLAEEGSLLLQGPFLDDTALRGFYIFNVSSIEEARRLTETDPMIRSGWLAMELRPWYGSAALQEVYGIHRRIRRKDH